MGKGSGRATGAEVVLQELRRAATGLFDSCLVERVAAVESLPKLNSVNGRTQSINIATWGES